jgi:cell division transport system permease protein
MQLVGATNSFIRLPFLLEGLIYGTAGAGVAAAVVYYGGESLLRFGRSALPFLPLGPTDIPIRALVISLISTGAIIGLIGSAASVRKFLRT